MKFRLKLIPVKLEHVSHVEFGRCGGAGIAGGGPD